uniref:Caspase-3 n=1 Tax=Sinocyclocheilus anshuiensis TaxID=1608454 RepID=A0A671K720_9TELE
MFNIHNDHKYLDLQRSNSLITEGWASHVCQLLEDCSILESRSVYLYWDKPMTAHYERRLVMKSYGMGVRNGTDEDAKNAMQTFSKLGFKYKISNDQTVSQMKDLLTKVSKEDHSKSAMFACVLLSHGDDGRIFGTDDCIELKELIALFRGDRCKSLVGKPKLFFIQACRGSDLDAGIECDGEREEGTQRIPVEADFLYVYSTAPGYYSWRNVANGSWFISSLCETLSKYSKQLEIMQIMTRVNHKVALDFKSCSNLPGFDGMKQIPCIVSMLTKELYFLK